MIWVSYLCVVVRSILAGFDGSSLLFVYILQYQYFFFRKSCFMRFITIYWPAIFIGEVYYYNHIQVLLFNIYHENNINLSN